MSRRLPLALTVLLALAGAGAIDTPLRAQDTSPGAAAPAGDSGELSDEDTALARQAVAALSRGDTAAAIALLEPVRERPQSTPPLLSLLGAVYLEADRPEDALAVLRPLTAGETADAAILYNAGRAALATGDTDQAARWLTASVRQQPGTPAARELGLLLGSGGAIQEAYQLLRPWTRAHPEDQEARLATALAAVRLGRVPDAEELLEGLPLELDRVRLLWGQLRLMQGDPRGAVAMVAPLIAAAGSAPGEAELDARKTLAEAHLALGESAEAIALLSGHAEGDAAATLQLGKAQYQAGELATALGTLEGYAEQLLALAQGDGLEGNTELAAAYALEYGRLLAAAGRHADAVPYLGLATALAANEKQAWQLLGQSLAAAGRQEEASDALARFQELADAEGPATARQDRLERYADDPTAREIERARDLLAKGESEQALRLLRQEIGLSPTDLRPRLLESRVLLLLDRPEEALAAAERTAALAPESADAVYQLAAANLALDRREEAETAFRRALELAPDHLAGMNDLAVLLIVQGERTEARALLDRALVVRPDDPQATETLQRLNQGAPPG